MSNTPHHNIIDIRKQHNVFTQIVFADLENDQDDQQHRGTSLVVRLDDSKNGFNINANRSYVSVLSLADARNLVLAINKAIDLRWVK